MFRFWIKSFLVPCQRYNVENHDINQFTFRTEWSYFVIQIGACLYSNRNRLLWSSYIDGCNFCVDVVSDEGRQCSVVSLHKRPLENGTVANIRGNRPCDYLFLCAYWDAPVSSRVWPVEGSAAISGGRKYPDPPKLKQKTVVPVNSYRWAIGANYDLLAIFVVVISCKTSIKSILSDRRSCLISNSNKPVSWLVKGVMWGSRNCNYVYIPWHLEHYVVISRIIIYGFLTIIYWKRWVYEFKVWFICTLVDVRC